MMKIKYFKNYEAMSESAASLVISEIKKKNDLLLCAATGHSPAGLYQNLVARYQEQKELFGQLRIVKLDEWGNVPGDHPVSCEYYLQNHLLKPINISASRYISFQADPADPAKECARMESQLEQKGPVDICILGIGTNGHIGMNEPAEFLTPHCHVAKLSESMLQHQMIRELKKKPSYGMTFGIGNIMESKKIILLITGENKEQATEEFLKRKISTALPASLLWLHQNVHCLIVGSEVDFVS